MSREIQVQKFCDVYRVELEKAVMEFPQQYTYSVSLVPDVVYRMREAFIAGTYNYGGIAIRRTCKILGIKHTIKAMEQFFNLPATPE